MVKKIIHIYISRAFQWFQWFIHQRRVKNNDPGIRKTEGLSLGEWETHCGLHQ